MSALGAQVLSRPPRPGFTSPRTVDGWIKALSRPLVWALDRFSRQGVAATLKLVEDLHGSGVKLWSYQEPFLRESDPAMAELVLSFLAWAAKQEHVRISERTKAGLERVRANGTRLGRPPVREIDPQKVRNLRSEGKSWTTVLKEMGLPKTALSAVQRSARGV